MRPSMEQLNYARKGSGFPLVLVHGYLGGAKLWDRQVAALKSDFDVIAPNLPGFADSASLRAPDTIGGFADRVLALLDDLGIERFHLLGHSMGGMIVQHMAAHAPDRISRLVCYGTGPVGMLPERFETIEQSRNRLKHDGLEAAVRRIAATWFVDGESARSYPICVTVGERASMQAALACLSAWEKWDGREALASVSADTLIIWGDRDRSYGRSEQETLLRGIRRSERAIVPGCAHNVHMEEPELFNRIVRDFLIR